MFATIPVLILLYSTVLAQDETYFDVYNLPGVPWKTREPHRLKKPEDVFNLSINHKIENFLDDYRKNHNYEAHHHTHKRRPQTNNTQIWVDVEKYSDYKKWTNVNEDQNTKYYEVQPEKIKRKSSKDDLESEYGEVIAPNDRKKRRFEQIPIKQANSTRNPPGFRPTGFSNVQKITKMEAANITRNNVNRMLRKFVNRLYRRKYGASRYVEIDPDDIDGEKSKFFGNGLDTLALLKNKTKSIANKFLNVFQVIKFNNTACQATVNGLSYQGVCYLASECASLNGTAGGACADGYGVCCVCK